MHILSIFSTAYKSRHESQWKALAFGCLWAIVWSCLRGDGISAESTRGVNSLWSNWYWREEWKQPWLSWFASNELDTWKYLLYDMLEAASRGLGPSAQATLLWMVQDAGATTRLWQYWSAQTLGCANVSIGAVQVVQPSQPRMSIAPWCHWRPEATTKIDIEPLCFWIDDVDVWPGPCMFHTRRSAIEKNKNCVWTWFENHSAYIADCLARAAKWTVEGIVPWSCWSSVGYSDTFRQ